MKQQSKSEGQTMPFTPDWDLIEGANETLREHMAERKAAQESERAFRERVTAALTALETALRPDLFTTAGFHETAMEILRITQEQLGIAPGNGAMDEIERL